MTISEQIDRLDHIMQENAKVMIQMTELINQRLQTYAELKCNKK